MQSDESLLIFCGNLRYLRCRHGLSKREMSRILGIGVKSLTLLENNTVPPRLGCKMLFRASRYFKIRTCDLFRPIEE